MSTLVLPAGSIGTFTQYTPLQQAVLGYLANYKLEKTRILNQRHLKVFLDWCEREYIDPLLIVAGQLSMYQRWLEQDGYMIRGAFKLHSESNISARWGVVRTFYEYACINDYVVKNRTLGLPCPTVDQAKQKTTFLDVLPFARFIEEAEKGTAMEFATVALLGIRALRIAEACSLNIEGIRSYRSERFIDYISKGGKATSMPLSSTVDWAIRRCTQGRDIGPILLNSRGNRMTRANATLMIKHIAAKAGVSTDISPHSLRRSFVTTGASMGVPLYDLQQTLQHKSSTTTIRYDQKANSVARDKSQVVDSYLMGLTG